MAVHVVSSLIVGSPDQAMEIALSGAHGTSHCDCDGVNAVSLLRELGCTPEITYSGDGFSGRSVLLCKIPAMQLQRLAILDHAALATFNDHQREEARPKLILLPRDQRLYAELYRRAVAAAAEAVSTGNELFARVETRELAGPDWRGCAWV